MRTVTPAARASSLTTTGVVLLATTGIVLLACAGIGVSSLLTLHRSDTVIGAATARTVGEIVAVDGDSVALRWRPAAGAERTDRVRLAAAAATVGTRTEVAYDPADPAAPLVPGSLVLADADRAASGVAFAAVVAAGVLVAAVWQPLRRARLRRLPGRPVALRRVRFQSGLLTRSWLETESTPRRWIPVHFDPLLVTLPAPAVVELHGDPRRGRLAAAWVDGRWLYPSGRVRRAEPRGRRTDNPSRPDDAAAERAAAAGRLGRRFRAGLPLVVPAPFVGLLWAYLDGGGAIAALAATVLAACLGLWSAALRGCDPS